MRFLADSRKRSAAMTVASAAAAFLVRSSLPAKTLSRWSNIGQALLPLLGTRR
jgi:hypothetical protein